MTDVVESPRKKIRIADLRPNQDFDDVFIIEGMTRKSRRTGADFLVVALADATGTLEGIIWDRIELVEQRGYKRDQYVRASGTTGEYNGKMNAVLKAMRPMPADQVNPADFVPVSPRDPAEMEGEFRAMIELVKHAGCHDLLRHCFHPNGKLWADFRVAPSARSVHQAYLHGLLEHTLNVTRNARALALCYRHDVDIDLVTTGALLHDVGKTVEFRWTPRIDYTELGLMLGHISIGATMVNDLARAVKIDPQSLAHLTHMVLSHHGRLEWGSPRTPATPEALVLHYADYADAQLSIYEETAKISREKGENWTEWNKFMERRLFAGAGPMVMERVPSEYGDDLILKSKNAAND